MLEGKGWRIPPHLYPPEVLPGTEPWIEAFFDLGTDRQIGMNGPGPIPSSVISAHTLGWHEDDAEVFRYTIRALDRAYLTSMQPDGDIPESDNPARDAFRAVMK